MTHKLLRGASYIALIGLGMMVGIAGNFFHTSRIAHAPIAHPRTYAPEIWVDGGALRLPMQVQDQMLKAYNATQPTCHPPLYAETWIEVGQGGSYVLYSKCQKGDIAQGA